MTMEDREFDADTQQLLADLKLYTAPGAGALDRVRERVAVSLTATLVGASSIAVAPTVKVGSAAPAGSWLATSAAKMGLVSAFALGTSVGALGYAWLRPATERVVYRDRPSVPIAARSAEPAPRSASTAAAQQPAPSAPAPEAMPRVALPEPEPRHAVAPPSSAKATFADAQQGLAGELQLMDRARAALSVGNASGALTELQSHAARYPRGTLQQEREALRIKALVSAGRAAEARAAGRRFAERYPDSSLLASVNAALRSIP